jgi:hypothetical protein
VIWRAAIWALAQAGNRAGKARHHLRSDETRSPGSTANLRAALARPLHLALALSVLALALRLCSRVKGPAGLMEMASASGAGDSRFESWAGQCFCEAFPFSHERGVESEPPVAFEPATSRRLTHG